MGHKRGEPATFFALEFFPSVFLAFCLTSRVKPHDTWGEKGLNALFLPTCQQGRTQKYPCFKNKKLLAPLGAICSQGRLPPNKRPLGRFTPLRAGPRKILNIRVSAVLAWALAPRITTQPAETHLEKLWGECDFDGGSPYHKHCEKGKGGGTAAVHLPLRFSLCLWYTRRHWSRGEKHFSGCDCENLLRPWAQKFSCTGTSAASPAHAPSAHTQTATSRD